MRIRSAFRVFFTVSAAVLILHCKKTSQQSPSSLPSQQPAASPGTIAANTWVDNEDGTYGWNLSFKDGKYTVHFAGEGCGGHEGTYSENGNTIVLKVPNEEVCTPEELHRGAQITCTLGKTDQSLFRQVYLHCGKNQRFWAMEPKVSANLTRKHGGQQVTTMGLKDGQITEEAMFRVKPSKSAAAISCQFYGNDMNAQKRKSLSKGTKIIVLARTLEKANVDKWSNYWYLIRPHLSWEDNCDQEPIGWVFGEFVKLD